MRIVRTTTYVEADGLAGRDAYAGTPRLVLDRDEPRVSDHGRRCAAGYVTISVEGADQVVIAVSTIRRMLDEYERTTS
jgi:hypothetical protein